LQLAFHVLYNVFCFVKIEEQNLKTKAATYFFLCGEHARAGRRRPHFLVKKGVFPQNSSESVEKAQQQHESGVKDMPFKRTGDKNKRGERGSTDDEIADPKCVNIASADFQPADAVEREDNQPNLSDIHAILKDLLKSMDRLSNEVAELKTSFKQHESELRTAKESLNAALKYNDKLKLELKATKQRVKEQEEEIDELYENMDTLEQYTRKNSLEIEGIPENVCNDEDADLKVTEALNINVKQEDINICHRIKRKKTKPIIARFISHKVKRALYKQQVQLRNVSFSQLFPSASAAARASSNRIFINENLTTHRRNLVRIANGRKEDGLLKGVRTVDRKIFVKTSPEGRPIRINTEDDLNNL